MKYLSQSVPNVDKRMSPLYPDPQPILWRRARLFSPVSLNLALSHESKGTWRMCFPLTGNNRRYMRQQQVTKLTCITIYIYILCRCRFRFRYRYRYFKYADIWIEIDRQLDRYIDRHLATYHHMSMYVYIYITRQIIPQDENCKVGHGWGWPSALAPQAAMEWEKCGFQLLVDVKDRGFPCQHGFQL